MASNRNKGYYIIANSSQSLPLTYKIFHKWLYYTTAHRKCSKNRVKTAFKERIYLCLLIEAQELPFDY